MAGWIAGGIAAANFLGGMFDDSDEERNEATVKSAAYNARYAYPGQKALGGKVSNYLWENLNMGLTEPEKRLMRGTGRTSILQGVKSATTDTRRQAAAQGLRGGTIANIIANIQQQKIPAFGKLETDIQNKDIDLKRKRIADILAFLGLSAGYGEDVPKAITTSTVTPTISSIVNNLYSGGTGGAGMGAGYGDANPGVAPASSYGGVSEGIAAALGTLGFGSGVTGAESGNPGGFGFGGLGN